MSKALYTQHHSLAVPRRIIDLVRWPWIQVTCSVSGVSTLFDDTPPLQRRVVEYIAMRYGVRVQTSWVAFAWYVDRTVSIRAYETPASTEISLAE